MPSFAQRLLDCLYPPECPACDALLGSAAIGLCPRCRESLYELGAACPRCAMPLNAPGAAVCYRCTGPRWPIARAVCPYRYGGELAVALRRLKYERRADIARSLAPLFADAFARLADEADLAVPMPLHWRRACARTFNQAERLLYHARRMAAVPVEVEPRLLRRRRPTASQARLGAAARKRNVAGAFSVPVRRRPQLAGKVVLLFDDIISTGATISAAARTLERAGARAVIAFAVARAE